MRETAQKHPELILIGLMLASLAALPLLPSITQDQDYHQFADQRTLLGIPHFWNVISNTPFIAVGAWGLWQFHRSPETVVLFSGMMMTGVGSAYYHLNPNDATLFWDRLPMTLCFAAVFAVIIGERINEKLGRLMLWPLLVIGVLSLLLWRWTGDLRLYAWAQFFPFVAIIAMILLIAPKYTGTTFWVVAFAFYAAAKLFEHYDKDIFDTVEFVSGHTLKHLAAAAACFAVLAYFQRRRPI
jgi:hypothetical protein